MKSNFRIATQLLIMVIVSSPIGKTFAQADMKETIALIKKNLADSKENVKKYEWIETTTTFISGEEKSKKQNQCYYSVDGQLTKVATGGTTPEKKKGGIRGKIAENKKEEMAEYVKQAITKIQAYTPPDGAKLQKIYADGKMAINVLEPGKKFKLSFPDYLEAGDMLSLSFDKEKSMIMEVSITTSVEDPQDKVGFILQYKTLPDGTQYSANTTLNAPTKDLKITIQNSGYKMGAGH